MQLGSRVEESNVRIGLMKSQRRQRSGGFLQCKLLQMAARDKRVPVEDPRRGEKEGRNSKCNSSFPAILIGRRIKDTNPTFQQYS
jgi:hypothetical protein